MELLNKAVTDEERQFDRFGTKRDKLASRGEKYLVLQSTERSRGNAGGDGPD